MKQSAVEWLEKKLIEAGLLFEVGEAIEVQQAKEMEKKQIIKHSVELAKLLFSNPIEKSGKTPQELVNSYFKNK